MAFKVGKIGGPEARRVWADTKDIPEATKALLKQCLKESITLSVITFIPVEDEWEIIAWGC